MACTSITAGLTPTCAALKKRGGANKRVWVGLRDDIDAYTQDGTSKKITDVTMVASKKLFAFIGKRYKNSGRYELVVGENTTVFNHIVSLSLYHETQLDRNAINALAVSEDLVVFMQNNAGQIEIFGLDIDAGTTDDPAGGLNPSSGAGGTGVQLQDDTAFTIELSGEVSHLPLLFEDTNLATSISTLDGLT